MPKAWLHSRPLLGALVLGIEAGSAIRDQMFVMPALGIRMEVTSAPPRPAMSRQRGTPVRMSRGPGKPYVVKIAKDIWEEGDSAGVSDYLIETLMTDQDTLRRNRAGVELVWGGLPDDGRPPWSIPRLADTIKDLDARWPLALYFFDREGKTLEHFQYSIGNARIVREGASFTLFHDQQKVGNHFATVWVPALAKVCEMAGLGQSEFDDCRNSALTYFRGGPRL